MCLSYAAPRRQNACHWAAFFPSPFSRISTKVLPNASPEPCHAPLSGWNPLRVLSLTRNCNHSRPQGPSSRCCSSLLDFTSKILTPSPPLAH